MSTNDRTPVPYEPPAIEDRVDILALLLPAANQSNVKGDVLSDVNVKEHVQPVIWGDNR